MEPQPDFSHLPPEQRRKKLAAKVNDFDSQISKATADRCEISHFSLSLLFSLLSLLPSFLPRSLFMPLAKYGGHAPFCISQPHTVFFCINTLCATHRTVAVSPRLRKYTHARNNCHTLPCVVRNFVQRVAYYARVICALKLILSPMKYHKVSPPCCGCK